MASIDLAANFKIADLASLPWAKIVPAVAATYLATVQMMRFRAIRAIEKEFADYIDDPYKLNYKQAQKIMRVAHFQDHPFIFAFATQWALIKSYGIAAGTPILVKTRQLSDPTKVGKRAEDTGVFLVEFLDGDIDSERARLTMGRLNWLHSQYPIKKTDYIHTMSLFVLEPQRWTDKYGWRKLMRLEKVARFLYWREIVSRMDVENIPETLEGLEQWRVDYEAKEMYYIPENHIVAESTLDLFLRKVPQSMHGVGCAIFTSFIEEKHVREALGYPDPPRWATALTSNTLKMRGFLLRHFFLPRSRPGKVLLKQGANGRYFRNPKFLAFEPWYVADTWLNRWKLWRKLGGDYLPSEKFQSEGYTQEELGPHGYRNLGHKEVRQAAEAMEEYIKNGGAAQECPFKFSA